MKIFLTGQEPAKGEQFCAICVMTYMGEISDDEKLQAEVKELTERYTDQDLDYVVYGIPNIKGPGLYRAITTAPTTFSNTPLPVCWTHVQGLPTERQRQAQKPASSLHIGKAYGKKAS